MSRNKPMPGRVSRVRSAMLEMELDHDSGVMRGTVLAGRFAGRALDDLERPDIEALARECAADADSARLLDSYADRRFPGWREAGNGDGDSRQRGDGRAGAMSKEEAYQILGLQPGAGEADIRAAHRALMKRVHPDQGGSTFLAAKVNEAKEILLGRHG
jgi:DnaJ-domain-containing protein 1